MGMKSILFVDDEPKVLQGLQRMLRPMRHEWVMAFAASGEQALELMELQSYDVVVSDMRMPGMDGVQLLTEVMRRSPKTVRLALSGQSSDETMLRMSGPTHQFLSKPCDPEVLRETVNRALALRQMLQEERLVTLASRLHTLPVLPRSYTHLLDELHGPEISIKAVGAIIESDVGMAAKTLQWVNSALFGIRTPVTSVTHAVSMLGLDVIRSMVLTMGVFSELSKTSLAAGFSLEKFMEHSVAVGAYAKRVAVVAGCNERRVNEAFTAGILHDTGRLVLAAGCPAEYGAVISEAAERCLPLEVVEQEQLGATHAEVGGYLLGLWGFPDPIVEAAAYHHRPDACGTHELTLAILVHAADFLVHLSGNHNGSSSAMHPEVAVCVAAGLDLLDPEWQRACFVSAESPTP